MPKYIVETLQEDDSFVAESDSVLHQNGFFFFFTNYTDHPEAVVNALVVKSIIQVEESKCDESP